LAAGIEGQFDVPSAGNSEAVSAGMAGECEAVADLFVEFVDGHGWLVSVDDVNLPACCISATIKSPPAKNNPQAGELATNPTARAAGCQGCSVDMCMTSRRGLLGSSGSDIRW
jgi:hypothetical protein